MMKRKDIVLDELLHNIKADVPPVTFTENVMEMLQPEIAEDNLLPAGILNTPIPKTSPGFTDNVLAGIQATKVKVHSPVISRKAFVAFGVIITLLTITGVFIQKGSIHQVDRSRQPVSFSIPFESILHQLHNYTNNIIIYLLPVILILVLNYLYERLTEYRNISA